MNEWISKYGSWALVTGGSSGLGREFAIALAEKGLNIIIVARDKAKLNATALEIETQFGRKVKVISADLFDMKSVDKIVKETKDLEIGLLINNASHSSAGAFMKQDLKSEINIVTMNVIVSLSLTYIFGKKMMEKKRGGIINLSSTFGYQAVPFSANYSATKAHTLHFGEALNFELRNSGVDVLVLSPGTMDTETNRNNLEGKVDMDQVPKMFSTVMSAKDVVQIGLNALGKRPSVIAGIPNKIQVWLGRTATRANLIKIYGFILGKIIHKDLQ